MGPKVTQLQDIKEYIQPLPPRTPLKKELQFVADEIGVEAPKNNTTNNNKNNYYYVKLYYSRQEKELCGISFEAQKYNVVYDVKSLSKTTQQALLGWASSLPDVVRKGLASDDVSAEEDAEVDLKDYREIEYLYYVGKEETGSPKINHNDIPYSHIANEIGAPKGVLLSSITKGDNKDRLTVPLQMLRLHSNDYKFYEVRDVNNEVCLIVVDSANTSDITWCDVSPHLAKIDKFTNKQFFYAQQSRKWFSKHHANSTNNDINNEQQQQQQHIKVFVVGDLYLPFWTKQ